MTLKFVHQFAIDSWEIHMTLSKMCWLEAEFLKVKETSQTPDLGAHTPKCFLGSQSQPSLFKSASRNQTEGTFHDENRTGRPESSLDLFIGLET